MSPVASPVNDASGLRSTSSASHAAPLNRNAWLTLAGGACFTPIEIGNRIFISSFLISVSSQIGTLGSFNLAVACGMALAILLGGGYCKRGGMLRVFRLGFVFALVFFTTAGVLRERLALALVPAGFVLGLSVGSFWIAYHLYRMKIVAREARLTLFSRSGAIIYLENLIFPVFFGWLISSTDSYVPFFLFCAVLLVLGFFTSSLLEEKRDGWQGAYDLNGFLRQAWRDPNLRKMYMAGFFMGLSLWGVLDIMAPLFVYLKTGSTLLLGISASVVPIFGMAASWLTRRIPARHYGLALKLSAVMLVSSCAVLMLVPGLPGVLLYYALFSCFAPVLAILYALHVSNVIDRDQNFIRQIPEHFVVNDLMLFAGRVPGFCALMLVSGASIQSGALHAVFLLVSLAVVPMAFLVSRIRLDVADGAQTS